MCISNNKNIKLFLTEDKTHCAQLCNLFPDISRRLLCVKITLVYRCLRGQDTRYSCEVLLRSLRNYSLDGHPIISTGM